MVGSPEKVRAMWEELEACKEQIKQLTLKVTEGETAKGQLEVSRREAINLRSQVHWFKNCKDWVGNRCRDLNLLKLWQCECTRQRRCFEEWQTVVRKGVGEKVLSRELQYSTLFWTVFGIGNDYFVIVGDEKWFDKEPPAPVLHELHTCLRSSRLCFSDRFCCRSTDKRSWATCVSVTR